MSGDLRLTLGFACKDGDAKNTTLQLVELEGALRLTTNDDATVIMTLEQAQYLRDALANLAGRVQRRQAQAARAAA